MATETGTESSLTAICDRNLENKWVPDKSRKDLTDSELKEAKAVLFDDSFTTKYKFPRSESVFKDPSLPNQTFALISFVPAKGAKPNDSGIYGMVKVRGTFSTDIEASNRAEQIIRNFDSYNTIQTCLVGFPIPLTGDSRDYSLKTNEIDLHKNITESMSASIKDKREKEARELREIQEREKQLLEDVKKTDEDPMDRYTKLRVKKAQITWTYLESMKKIEDMKNIIIKTRSEIAELDSADPALKETYYKKYLDARAEAGLDLNRNTTQKEDTFMQFLTHDPDLGF